MLLVLYSLAQTLRHRTGGMNSMGMAGYPKRDERRNHRKQTAMTIFTHPTSTIALHHIFFFLCHSRKGSEAPPSTKGPKGLCIVLCKQASPAPHVSMYGGRMCKMGLKEEMGEGEEEGRKKGEIHRSCRSVAGQGLGRSVFVIELETHSPPLLYKQTKQTNTKIFQSQTRRANFARKCPGCSCGQAQSLQYAITT